MHACGASGTRRLESREQHGKQYSHPVTCQQLYTVDFGIILSECLLLISISRCLQATKSLDRVFVGVRPLVVFKKN